MPGSDPRPRRCSGADARPRELAPPTGLRPTHELQPAPRSPAWRSDHDAQADRGDDACPDSPAASPCGAALRFGVARSLDEVVNAWRMVYMAYRRIGLIDPNPQRIHTAPHAVGPHAAIVAGSVGPWIISTLTALADGPRGLPLDRVYGHELHALRCAGRSLMEVGLFADRRRQLHRTADALFHLMRYAFYFGLSLGVSDFVIGVHPRHARFYQRSFGFSPFGRPRTYPAVNDRPVVLLRADVAANLRRRPRHPALDFFAHHPLPPAAFAPRFAFREAALSRSTIEEYLAWRDAQAAAADHASGTSAAKTMPGALAG